MTYSYRSRVAGTQLVALLLAGATPAISQDTTDDVLVLDPITVESAAEELKQAPGASTISSDDIIEQPVSNDVSEIVRKMPGVNLTGNTTTGQRGNNRQIDIRGMGPENTLILIDGRPVLSRNSVKMGRSGERDTRGDSNWVPAEAIDRIEVLRGPAAARYGSGSAGGVVNIITKKTDQPYASVTLYGEMPEHDEEGGTRRANVVFGGPLGELWTYRTILNYAKTDGDDPDINADATPEGESVAAGREGVENKDFSQLFEFHPDDENTWGIELSYSRQGNEYAGDTQFREVLEDLELSDEDGNVVGTESLIGEETNIMRRGVLALTHRGEYAFGDSNSYLQWEHTENERLMEGLAGGGEGVINSPEYGTITLDTVSAKTEWNVYSDLGGVNQTFTFGADYRGEWMDDDISNQMGLVVDVPGSETDPADRDSETNAQLVGLYIEDNILLTDEITLTPGLRADWHSEAGFNLSPSLNAAWQVSPEFSVKAGVSRAFKAPNLYQLNPDYVYYTRGNGCPVDYPNLGAGCHILGNPDLDPETSWNKEIGVNYNNAGGWNAGLTYFHNDYQNRIAASLEPAATVFAGYDENGDPEYTQVFRWENTKEAVIEGIEANLRVPLLDSLTWSTNATMMLNSEDKETGQPLSLVPDYTINTQLDWSVTDSLDLLVSATHYGETPSPEKSVTSGAVIENPESRDPYTLVDLGAVWQVNDVWRVNAGVKNVFDERVFREGTSNNAGANTYNEPGRTFTLGLNATF
ncbi:FepA family TonB-dependent siderophore receptor [Qingshengfaniella alkalisoli]|uniref:TonB-dependent siderophore receptor n=1 Tax=Qingshengfaniella alkalisoli TaxID=2599296 RepID=A0A5B8J3M2_9RHOB|nr:FepA family TonB-dependent siderophore receptor [Qingshengfaniella alkalisoli]QDY71308.1 TonB-dependent siderophore receptor [Qingshengfaniella alkalisoli]